MMDEGNSTHLPSNQLVHGNRRTLSGGENLEDSSQREGNCTTDTLKLCILVRQGEGREFNFRCQNSLIFFGIFKKQQSAATQFNLLPLAYRDGKR